MYIIKKLVIAIALTFPAVVFAQTSPQVPFPSAQQLTSELEALKAKTKALEDQVTQINEKAVETEAKNEEAQAEFNRVKVTSEAMEDALELSGLKGMKISGYIDPTYMYNERQRTGSFTFMKNFGDYNRGGANAAATGSQAGYAYDNAFFGTAFLSFFKEMEGGTKWTLELMPSKSYGDAGGANGTNGNGLSIVNQAFVSVPLSDLNNRFMAGQIGSWMGYEYPMAAGPTMKKTITNNLLFDFTDLTFMTGIGVEHIAGPWDWKVIAGNMNNGRITDHLAPSIHWRFDYSKEEFWGIGGSGVEGKPSSTTNESLAELDAYFIRGLLTVQGQLETGLIKNGAFNGGDAKWNGLSTLVAYRFLPRFEVIGRFDYLNNAANGGGVSSVVFPTGCQTDSTSLCGDYRNGFGPGINSATGLISNPNSGANRAELTLGLDYTMTKNVMLKFELRHDTATQNVFYDVGSNSYVKNNNTLGMSTVASF